MVDDFDLVTATLLFIGVALFLPISLELACIIPGTLAALAWVLVFWLGLFLELLKFNNRGP